MSPDVIETMRLTIRMAVVLPQPDGPTSTQMSPAGTSNESDLIAGSSLPGYVFETWRNSSDAAIRGLYPSGRAGFCVRLVLEGVVERIEAVETQRGGDEPVGEARVLRQQRAVQVGPDHVAAAHALEAVAAVVAVAAQHAAEWLLALALSRVRPAAVVLESGQHPDGPVEVDLDGDVADQARTGLAYRAQVDEADPGELLVAELVGGAGGLVAAAYRQHHLVGLGGGVQSVALDRGHVACTQGLVAVLPAADVEQVMGVGVDPLAQAGGVQAEAEPAPRTAALQHEQVAAVGVDVHEVGVQRADTQLRRHATSPPWSRRALRLARCGGPARPQSRRRRPRPRASPRRGGRAR